MASPSPSPRASSSARGPLHAALLWLLLLALPIYGASGTLLQILGPAHRHSQAVVALQASADVGSSSLQQAWEDWMLRRHLAQHAMGLHRHDSAPVGVGHLKLADLERAEQLLAQTSVGPASAAQLKAVAVETVATAAAEPHGHGLFERHHHLPGTDGVELLSSDVAAADLLSQLGAEAGVGSATLPLALAGEFELPQRQASLLRRASEGVARWQSADPRRKDRPPQGDGVNRSPGALA